MLEVIPAYESGVNGNAIASMHRLRCRVFKERLGWDVNVINGMEFDQFDNDNAFYIVLPDENGEIVATSRLIPTTCSYLLGDVFPQLVDGDVPRKQDIWEITRFAADEHAPANATALLVLAMLEFGISQGIQNYVSMSDIRIEPILRRIGWPPTRLGEPIDTGTERSAGEIFEVSREALARVREKTGITTSVLTQRELDRYNKEKVA